MSYVEPVNGKLKHKGRKKNLNIYNTDKIYNFETRLDSDIKDYIHVTAKTKPDIDSYLLEANPVRIALDDNIYQYYQGALGTDKTIISYIEQGLTVCYYAHDDVSDDVLDALAKAGQGFIIYTPRKVITRDFVNNVQKAHEATKVCFFFPMIMPDIQPTDVISYMDKFKTNVDEVQLSFEPLVEKNYTQLRKPFYYQKIGSKLHYMFPGVIFSFFKLIKDPLSSYGMRIVILSADKDEKKALDDMAEKDEAGGNA